MRLIPELLILAGYAALCYGVWLVMPAAGYIVGGALAIAAGLRLARSASEEKVG